MPEQPAKKLNLPLYLNASLSRADGAAMVALQQWYEKAQNSCGDRAELEGMIRAFHHDLYLAGLRLYLLDPRLCRQVADALAQQDLSVDGLAKQLSSCGLWPEVQTGGFSAVQLKQLEELLSTAAPASAAAADPSAAAEALSQQLGEQKQQLSAMQAELQKLRLLAEEQARQLRGLKVAAPAVPAKGASAGGAEELDVSNMTANIAKMKKVRGKGVF